MRAKVSVVLSTNDIMCSLKSVIAELFPVENKIAVSEAARLILEAISSEPLHVPYSDDIKSAIMRITGDNPSVLDLLESFRESLHARVIISNPSVTPDDPLYLDVGVIRSTVEVFDKNTPSGCVEVMSF